MTPAVRVVFLALGLCVSALSANAVQFLDLNDDKAALTLGLLADASITRSGDATISLNRDLQVNGVEVDGKTETAGDVLAQLDGLSLLEGWVLVSSIFQSLKECFPLCDALFDRDVTTGLDIAALHQEYISGETIDEPNSRVLTRDWTLWTSLAGSFHVVVTKSTLNVYAMHVRTNGNMAELICEIYSELVKPPPKPPLDQLDGDLEPEPEQPLLMAEETFNGLVTVSLRPTTEWQLLTFGRAGGFAPYPTGVTCGVPAGAHDPTKPIIVYEALAYGTEDIGMY